jgi:hypothetical protein
VVQHLRPGGLFVLELAHPGAQDAVMHRAWYTWPRGRGCLQLTQCGRILSRIESRLCCCETGRHARQYVSSVPPAYLF